MTSIAFLGLGAMGSRMAANLLRAGHDVTLWNRDPARADPLVAEGARRALSPRAAAAEAEMVLAMVRDDAASRAVWSDPTAGALPAMRPGAVAIDCSTLTVGWARDLARDAAARGIGFLDAPVSGSRPQAEAAQLIFFVGGDAAVLAAAAPVLAAMGASIRHAGSAGSGAAIKLVVNALLGAQVAAVAELIGLVEALGLDPAPAWDIVGSTPVASPAANGAAAAMLASAFAPLFPVELVEKDLRYVQDTAAAAGARTPMTTAARAIMAQAIAAGFGAENLTGIVRLYR